MASVIVPAVEGATRPLRLRSVLPLQPRFLREVVVIPVENGIFVDGADRAHVFQGDATKGVIQDVIALADGTRTLKQLEAAIPGTSREKVREVMSLLFAWGLIEDGAADSAIPIAASETVAFLRRSVGATRINASGREAYARLESSKVVLVNIGPRGQHTDMLRSLLEKSGIGQVIPMGRESLQSLETDSTVDREQSLLVSFSFAGEDCEWHAELDDWCFRHRFRWLRTVLDKAAGYSDIGPLFKGRQNPCYRCFQAVHVRESSAPRSMCSEPLNGEVLFWTGMVATEIIYMLSRIGPLASGRSFHRYHLGRWTTKQLRCLRVPGCSRCRPDGLAQSEGTKKPGSQDLIDTAVAFEDHIGLATRDLSAEKEDPRHLQLSLALTREARYLANCAQHPLSPQLPKLDRSIIDVLLTDGTNSEHTLKLDELAAALLLTAGIRGEGAGKDTVKRWAPTGGNLGSVELFVVARQVEGLEPGFYAYEPKEHSLACFRRRGPALEIPEFMRRVAPSLAVNLPDALVILTAAFHRVSRKYGPFAYRLINLDAGSALAQLHAVTKSLNIRSETLGLWADDLIEQQLNLERMGEQVTAVVALNRSTTGSLKGEANLRMRRSDVRRVRSSTKAVSEFYELPLSEIVNMVYHESRIHESELTAGLHGPSEVIEAGTKENEPFSMRLSATAEKGRTVEDVLRSRTSIRHYAADPVSVVQLSTMLRCAHRGDVTDWPDERRQGDSLTYVTLALHVTGLSPGVYAYDSGKHALILTGPAPSSQQRVEMFLQKEFALAPVVIWIVGNLASACARHGAFGHRQLLVRAGAAGHRLWLAGIGMGLSGTLVAGMIAGSLEKYLGIDGYKQAGFLAVPLGHGARYFRWPAAARNERKNGLWRGAPGYDNDGDGRREQPSETL